MPDGIALPAGMGPVIDISEDGQTIVYVGESESGRRQLYRREVDQYGSTPISGTEGAALPSISPNADEVVFHDFSLSVNLRVDLSGGNPERVARGDDRAFWADDRHIYFSRNQSIMRIPEQGGAAESALAPKEHQGLPLFNLSHVLPGGRGLLVERGQIGDFKGFAVVDLQSKEIVEVFPNGKNPIYASTGHILFVRRNNTVYAVPFDVELLKVTGPEVPVLQGVRVENGGAAQFDVSGNGTLVYAPGTMGTELVWVDLKGKLLDPATEESHVYFGPRLSPDGKQVVLQINDNLRSEISILNIADGDLHLFPTPSNVTNPSNPIWSHDGKRVAFAAETDGEYSIQWALAVSGGEPEILIEKSKAPIYPETFSHDGSLLIFREDSPEPHLFTVQIGVKGSRKPLIDSTTSAGTAVLSHDGNWLAYTSSNSSGIKSVYVRPFPGPGVPTLISKSQGDFPIWGPDDTELFYVKEEKEMWVVPLQRDPLRRLDEKRLFKIKDFWTIDYRAQYDVSSDGERILIVSQRSKEAKPRINVIGNWFEELKRKSPTWNSKNP